MSLSHLFPRDVSSDLKAEIINQGQPAQTNTHTRTRARAHKVESAASDVLLIQSGERAGVMVEDKMELGGKARGKI